MNKKDDLCNQLKAVRTRLSLSQQDLAAAAGVARQTIGGIEAGTYALSLTIALRLSKALGCAVEDLFWLENDLPVIEAIPTGDMPPGEHGASVPVALAQIGGRWIASPLVGEDVFRQEMIPADGIGTWDDDRTLKIRLLDAPEALAQTVRIAGCTPALSLWARSAERWHPGLRVHWAHANSTEALARLAAGEVHAAGVHLFDPKTGEGNAPFVRAALPDVPTVLVNLGVWEEGLLVAPGNPKDLHNAHDLTQSQVTLINRESGAGSRLLLDTLLSDAGVSAATVTGYDRRCALGHFEVARAIREGRADVGVSTAGVAAAYGLSFVPLHAVRYDLALRKESLELTSVQQLLSTMHHRWVRSQLGVVGGYDTTLTGEMVDVGSA